MKIRIGNDFKTKWAITWVGEPEDFSDATDIALSFNIYDKKIELTKDVDYTITDNIIEIDCTPDICNILGVYNLELHYTKPNSDFIDGERRSAVDIDAFRIVGKSDKADSTQNVSIISDAVAIFLDIAYKKLEEIEANEDVRITNEGERKDAESVRVENENIRINNEQQRQIDLSTAIGNAEQATLNANNSATYANEQGAYANEQGAYAEEMSSHPPTIINDYWHIWNLTTNQYESTGQYARGDSAVDGALVVQEKGQSAVNTMSQKAVTDELVQLAGDMTRLATISIRNLIKNGNFAKGTENWTGIFQMSVSGNVLSVTGNNLYKYSGTQQYNVPFRYDTGRKIYVKVSMRVTNSAASSITLYLRNGDGLYATSRVINSPVENQWYTIEEIITLANITVPTDTMRFEIRQVYADNETASGKVMEVKEAMAIDFLESLQETTTLSDIQGYLVDYPNGWFDGSHIIKDVPTIYKELDEMRLNSDNELNKLRLDATISIENKIKNGDFSDGDHQWVTSAEAANATVVDNILQIKNKGVYSNSSTRQDIGVEYIRNQSVYCKATVRVRDSLCNTIQLGCSNSDGNYATYQTVNTPNADEWYTIEGIFTVNNDYNTPQSRVIIVAKYSSESDALDKILEIKNVIALDISDFGSEMTLSDVQTFLASYPNSWFDGAITLKTLSNVYNELIDKIGEGGGSEFIKKQPVGLLDDWKVIPDTNGTLGTTRALGYDGYLYYLRGLRIRRLTDVLTGANDIGIPWTLPYPRFICVFPSGIVYAINDTDGEGVKTVKIWKAPDIHTEPTLVATLEGGHTASLACNSFYDGINELVMIGGYEQTKGFDRFMYLSTDGGETFTNVKTTIGANAEYNWHWHAAAYDPYQGRIWISEGDDPASRAIWYSENMGVSWSRIQSNDYQPTLIMPFPNKVIFGRDHGSPGIDAYIRQKTSSEIMPVSVLQDNLTFRKDIAGALYYPSQPQAQEGVEAYISFGSHIAGGINYIYATGDGAESWHCVYSSVNGLGNPIIVGDYIVALAGLWGDTAMYYTPKLGWE